MLRPKSKILLIGGGGYVGRAVVKSLGQKGVKKVVVYGRRKMGIVGVGEIEGDVTNPESLERAFKNCRVAVYLVTENKSREAKDHFRANVEGLKNSLEAGKKVGIEKFIYVSTTMVFKKREEVVDETNYEYRQSPTGNLYVDSKTEGVKVVKGFKGLKTIIVYPSVVVNRDFLYQRPVGAIGRLKQRLGLMTQGGVMLRAGDSTRRMSYVFLEELAELVTQLIINNKYEREYLAVSVNTTPGEQIRKSRGKVSYFPFHISNFIFKKVFGEAQLRLMHEENHYSNLRMRKLVVGGDNTG